jgi:hypothetical protein
MDAVIKDIPLTEQELWDEARKSTQNFVADLRKTGVKEFPHGENLGEQTAQLLALWLKALVAQKPDADAVKTAFEAGKFQAAARALETALGVASAGKTMGDTEVALTGPAEVAALQSYAGPKDVAAPQPAGAQAAAPDIESPELFEAFGAVSFRGMIRAKALQTIISGVALTIVGYLIFADKFVGTSGDLLSAFFWGFTTDIGVDALIVAAKSKQTT